MVRTRIFIGQLTREKFGTLDLPEEVEFFCPQCGNPCADKGTCKLSLEIFPNRETKNEEVKLVVDCGTCGCYGKAPVVEQKR